MKTYAEKLKDPRWQRRRLEIMARDGFACVDCEDKEATLAVHHAYYISGRDPWAYPDWSLTTLCEECHKHAHLRERERSDDCRISEWEAVIGFLGIKKMDHFGDWWDFATGLAMRKDEFEKRGIRPIDWVTWAYEGLLEEELKSALPETNEQVTDALKNRSILNAQIREHAPLSKDLQMSVDHEMAKLEAIIKSATNSNSGQA